MPAYNTAQFISEALDSVFAQTLQDFEVIIVNDGSPDTGDLEKAILPYRSRIKYLKQENRGAAAARNTGIRHSNGRFIAFLDSDDTWSPDYLAAQLTLFEGSEDLDVLYCDAMHFGDSDDVGKTFMQSYPSSGLVTLQALITETCQIPCSFCIARRQAVWDAGCMDENLQRCEDYDLWLRILYRGGRIKYQARVLGGLRFRRGSLSRDAHKVAEALVAIYEKAEGTMNLTSRTHATLKKRIAWARAHFNLEVGKRCLVHRDFDHARHSLKQANQFFRRPKLSAVIFGLRFAPEWTRVAALTWQGAIAKW